MFRNDKLHAGTLCMVVMGWAYLAAYDALQGDPLWRQLLVGGLTLAYATLVVRSIWRDRA